MIYLIGQLSIWLVLTAAFAAVAGWAFASERSAEAERALRRDRDHLIRDLTRLASEDAATSTEVSDGERETDALRRQLEIRDGRMIVPNRPGIGITLSEQALAWVVDSSEHGKRP